MEIPITRQPIEIDPRRLIVIPPAGGTGPILCTVNGREFRYLGGFVLYDRGATDAETQEAARLLKAEIDRRAGERGGARAGVLFTIAAVAVLAGLLCALVGALVAAEGLRGAVERRASIVRLPPAVADSVTVRPGQSLDLGAPCARCRFVVLEIGADGDAAPILGRWEVRR